MKWTISGRPLLRFKIVRRERPVSKASVIAARIIVTLAGLVFGLLAIGIIMAGYRDDAWLLVGVGSVLALGAILLLWSGITSNRNDVCDAAVFFLAELLFGWL